MNFILNDDSSVSYTTQMQFYTGEELGLAYNPVLCQRGREGGIRGAMEELIFGFLYSFITLNRLISF